MAAALSLDDWKTRASGLTYRNQAFINGKFVPAISARGSRHKSSWKKFGPCLPVYLSSPKK